MDEQPRDDKGRFVAKDDEDSLVMVVSKKDAAATQHPGEKIPPRSESSPIAGLKRWSDKKTTPTKGGFRLDPKKLAAAFKNAEDLDRLTGKR